MITICFFIFESYLKKERNICGISTIFDVYFFSIEEFTYLSFVDLNVLKKHNKIRLSYLHLNPCRMTINQKENITYTSIIKYHRINIMNSILNGKKKKKEPNKQNTRIRILWWWRWRATFKEVPWKFHWTQFESFIYWIYEFEIHKCIYGLVAMIFIKFMTELKKIQCYIIIIFSHYPTCVAI